MKKFLILILLCSSLAAFSKHPLIQSGPMLGYADIREALLWVQTTQSAEVYFKYYETGNTSKVYQTDKFNTQKTNSFIAKLIADSVESGKNYTYEVFINGEKSDFDYNLDFNTPLNWRWKTEPPNFKFALGSCFFINDAKYDRVGKPYGGEYFIANSILEKKPEFMVWLGDNVYLREGDWNTRTGIYYRWTNSRSVPELQALLASVHHYGIWDDHDYGPDNADRSFWNKSATKDAFIDFSGNPQGIYQNTGITFKFEWGDCDFFMMDNRWFRAPDNDSSKDKDYLGKNQLRWLIDNLLYSPAKFKFVCIGGQVLNPLQVMENYSNYTSELKILLDAINKYNIKGIVFLTGDRHYSELTKMNLSGGTKIFDFTSSTLTAGENKSGCVEDNALRVDGSCFDSRNFGMIEVSGPKNDRKLNLILFDNKGNEVWNYKISEKDF